MRDANHVPPLSEREREVLFLAADGLTDKEIAQRLGIGAKTVRTYWDRIRGKLGASSRTQALSMALRAAFDELAASEARLRSLLEEMPTLLLATDSDGRVAFHNRAVEDVLGLRADQVDEPATLLEQLYQDEHARQDAAERWTVTHQLPMSGEQQLRTSKGDVRTISWQTHPGHGDSWVVGVDITESMTTHPLPTEETVLKVVMDSASDAMWLVNREFQTVHVNQAMAFLLNASTDELFAKTPLDFIADEDRAGAAAVVAQGGGTRLPFRFLRCDGTFIPVRKSLVPIHRHGQVTGYLIVATEGRDK